jgi:hypothetical protein
MPITNLWWARKRKKLDEIDKPAPRPMTEVEKLIFAVKCKDPAEWEQAAREMDAAGITPEEIARTFAAVIAKLAEAAEPETPCVKKHLSHPRVQQIEQHLAGLRGESADPANAVAAYVEKYLAAQRAQVDAGQMTSAAYDLNRTRLGHFLAFSGLPAEMGSVDADTLDTYYQYVLKKLRKAGQKEGWSVDYVKGVFNQARRFIRYSARRCGACQMPANIDDPFKFGLTAKKVLTWTPIEFMQVIDETPGKLKLCLLLMVNCGMTQKDVSDLLDDEVD